MNLMYAIQITTNALTVNDVFSYADLISLPIITV